MAPQLPPSGVPVTPDRAGARLSLEGVGRRYGDRWVLKDLDLEVEPGSFVSFLGPSGAGKSTLLRIVAGLEQPSSGTARLHGSGPRPPMARMMFQEDRLLPWRSAEDNVLLGVRGRREEARALLDAVGLTDRGDAWPSALSGGQRQRVALARALLHHPELLLLDEPFGALDAITRIAMQRLLERMWLDQPRTVLLVTHDVEEALVLSDRVLVLADGSVGRDLSIDLPRGDRRGHPRLVSWKEELLSDLVEPASAAPGAA
ncbi:ABC transporter ATP-binding protein [Streptomyces hygroscopicus subsp. hygroscopicus]|uniref:ABC transporter ATP-binding protein n=1 Tax=Streptomyces hygroscopicus TaxID=1912 RepID=UPI00099E6E12|nr:ABC transporter ATP-binding protein [Streptomyces hygroscopicus]MBW8089628.1 ABC transporter ATP-binding protein [Streptomyces hygroscopicus subsp. hygroscopicus]